MATEGCFNFNGECLTAESDYCSGQDIVSGTVDTAASPAQAEVKLSTWSLSVGIFLKPETENHIPVFLLTGFFGSGKTTLLNHLVRHSEMSNCVIVINEFGDIPLDQNFIEKSDGEVLLMANGCMCCSVQGDFEGVMGALFAKRSRGDVPDFDRLLIETTGLADPTSIMQLFLSNPLITKNFRLEAVVTTVDAVHGQRQLDEHDEAARQVAVADRILITKIDLAEVEKVDALSARLSEINSTAPTLRVMHGRVAPTVLFGGGLSNPATWLREPERRPESLQAPSHHVEKGHGHHPDIMSFTLAFDEPVQWKKFSGWLNKLKIRHADRLLRVKGIVNVVGEDGPVAIHGVHHVFHPAIRLPKSVGNDLKSCVVFITRGLTRHDIEADWQRFDAESQG